MKQNRLLFSYDTREGKTYLCNKTYHDNPELLQSALFLQEQNKIASIETKNKIEPKLKTFTNYKQRLAL